MKNLRTFLFTAALGATLVPAQPTPGGVPGGGAGDGIWRRNAYYGENQTFDSCTGHQPGTGDYHYHANPVCLRAQLNDNIVATSSSRTGTTYQEAGGPFQHSPILGWMFDGYPIYGPYGYSDAADASSPVKRLQSSFQLRAITARTTLPDWALPNHAGVSQQLSSSQYGPAISVQYPLGRYVEDYEFVNGLGDLDQYNGRYEVTPDFPNGTYAYHIAIDANGQPAFPYIVGGQVYGSSTGGRAQTVPSGVQTYFNASATSPANATSPLPSLASWAVQNAAQTAQVVSGYDPSAGASSTWPSNVPAGVRYSGGVSAATSADIQQVRYDSSNLYVNAAGLASYSMGPWFDPTMTGGVFSNFPSNQSYQMRIPLAASPATTKTSTSLGPVGIWVNGVTVLNFLDGSSYSNARAADQGGGNVFPTAQNYSAASLERGPFAPGSVVMSTSLFGAVLGPTVTVKDSSGTSRAATVLASSDSQVTYIIPAGSTTGFGTVTFTVGSATATTNINIIASYPNLYSPDAMAPAFQKAADGTATVTVYGSGIGNSTAWSATIGGTPAVVVAAGPSGTAGVDQYTIAVPAGLAGQGPLPVVVVADGRPSNAVTVSF